MAYNWFASAVLCAPLDSFALFPRGDNLRFCLRGNYPPASAHLSSSERAGEPHPFLHGYLYYLYRLSLRACSLFGGKTAPQCLSIHFQERAPSSPSPYSTLCTPILFSLGREKGKPRGFLPLCPSIPVALYFL